MLSLITDRLEIVLRIEYEATLAEAQGRIKESDPGDVPFLALAMARGADGIWTQNTRDYVNGGVPLWTTEKVVEWVRKRSPT